MQSNAGSSATTREPQATPTLQPAWSPDNDSKLVQSGTMSAQRWIRCLQPDLSKFAKIIAGYVGLFQPSTPSLPHFNRHFLSILGFAISEHLVRSVVEDSDLVSAKLRKPAPAGGRESRGGAGL